MATNKKILLTQSDLQKVKEEFEHLVHVEKPKVIEDLALARSQGDLSENADYDAAREHQARIEARITELTAILNNYALVDEKAQSGNAIAIGSTVTFKDLVTGEISTVEIKGNMGADPLAEIPAISNESPLSKALIGSKVGAKVTVECAEPYEIEILEAKRA